MERVFHRAGLLQHEQEFALTVRQFQLILGVLRVDVLQLELGGGEDLRNPVEFLLGERHVALRLLQTILCVLHVSLVDRLLWLRVRMKTRMTAPNPQQMQSRKARLNTSVSRRLAEIDMAEADSP